MVKNHTSRMALQCIDLIMPYWKVMAPVIQGEFIYGDMEALQNLLKFSSSSTIAGAVKYTLESIVIWEII